MKCFDPTIRLAKIILMDENFDKICHTPDSTIGNYYRIGKIKCKIKKKFLIWEYYKNEYSYQFEVLNDHIRCFRKYYDIILNDIKKYIDKYEKLSNYEVKIKFINEFIYFTD